MKMDVQMLRAALVELEEQKGISEATVVAALEDALKRTYIKGLGSDKVNVVVNLDLNEGTLEMYHTLTVTDKDPEEDDYDDFIEINVDVANQGVKGKKYKAGDEFREYASIDTLKNATLFSIRSIMKQRFTETERAILYEAFQDKIGTMITGTVEAIEERGASINIGKTSVFLPRKEMIGDEKFKTGDKIKLYVNNVASGSKGAHIEVSRACNGFLESIFKEEIPDIYNGTIKIRAIARQAGERSKVAVSCEDPNVDPAGACIGLNGAKIQKIVAQLGDGISNKEKVDVIQYYENPSLFICEALKPARIVGIDIDEEARDATVIVKDDSLSLAIGRKGVNARLAVKLTGYKIDILTETEATTDGLRYVSKEELDSIAAEIKATAISEAQKKQVTTPTATVLPGLPEGYVAPQQRVYVEEKNDIDAALEEASENEEFETPTSTSVKEVKPTDDSKIVEVKTTTSLSDLEASLEAESKKDNSKKAKFTRKPKKEEKSEEEVAPVTKPTGPQMSIYSEEELKALEEEENNKVEEEIEEEIDYDDYDDYYDNDR